MESLTPIFLVTLGALGSLCAIAIWSPRKLPARVAALVLTGLLVPLGYGALSELLARPKPVAHEWALAHVDRATVLGVSFDEGKAIYLWLGLEGSREPRYYVLPWQPALAGKLQEGVAAAIGESASVAIEHPFSETDLAGLAALNVELVRPPGLPPKQPPVRARVFNPGAGRY